MRNNVISIVRDGQCVSEKELIECRARVFKCFEYCHESLIINLWPPVTVYFS